MDIQTRKIKFVQKFLKIKDEDVLLHFEELLELLETKGKTELKPFTVKELNRRIDQSEKDFENERYKTTSELFKAFDL